MTASGSAVRHDVQPMRVPKIGVPFLDALQVVHGPPGLLGRFFMQVDHRLRQQGLTLSFTTFEEMSELNARYQDNWGLLNPMFDPRLSDIPANDTMCLAVRNAAGELVATTSGKYFDASRRSFKQIVEDGDFLSVRPVDGRQVMTSRITAPIASELHGRLCYCGAIWVRPDVRGLRLPALLSRIVNACMLTLWDPDYVMGFVKPDVVGSDLYKRYGYEKAENSFEIYKDGARIYEGVFLWMTGDDATGDLARFLDVLWPQIDAAIISRNR
jgi:hypothetical protein